VAVFLNNINSPSGDLLYAVPALTNAGPDYDPRGGPLKRIVQSKKRTNVMVHLRKLG
jgi:hypothetical protein